MDLSFSEEQEMLRKSARDFLDEKCKKSLVKAMEHDERGYPPELWAEMAGLGWQGLVLPEEYGGSGMSFLDLAVLLEEMGRACLPGPFSPTVLAALTILNDGRPEQKASLLPGIASGKALATSAIVEEDGLYSPGAIRMKAQKAGADYTLNGRKLFVPDAHVADWLICPVRTAARSSEDEGISVFVIDAKARGLSLRALSTIGGDKQFEVLFKDVRVPAPQLVGQPNKGWPIIEANLERAAVSRCCEMVGMMQRVLEMTVAYAKERKQFGKPIGSLQVIQHYCANMATDVDGARFVTYQAAWRISEGLPGSMEAAIAKAWVSEAFGRVITLAHQIHGAIGCTIDHELQYYTKRGKQGELSYGSAERWREVVAQEMGL